MSNVFMKFRPFEGPSRYVFTDPDTNYQYKAENQAQLVKQVIGYRTQNRLEPIEALDAVLENYWCHLPENKGKCTFYTLKRGFLQTLKGGISLLTNYMYDKFVTQEKADARAEVCSKCPHNVHPEKGKFDAWADEIAVATIGERKTKYDTQLGTCELCGCPLRCRTWFGGAEELDQKELMQFPGFCWRVKEYEKITKIT